MSSAQGRFTSPDEPFADQNPADPRSWNLYSYVRNNPLRYTDPDGHDVQVCVDNGQGGQNCTNFTDDQYKQLYQQQNGQQGIDLPAFTLRPVTQAITCGGTTCGSATYFEPRRELDSDTFDVGVGIMAGKAAEPLFASLTLALGAGRKL
jgi:hypothetical protein